MISIIFPPGAYGNFLASSLYLFTDLIGETDHNFKFGPYGDSHYLWTTADYKNYKTKIQTTHIPYISSFDKNKLELDKTIVIKPRSDHLLDYFDNVYTKFHKEDLKNHFLSLFPENTINKNLKKFDTNWDDTNLWQMREFISFWIDDVLKSDFDSYTDVEARWQLSSLDLFNPEFVKTFVSIASALGLSNLKIEDFSAHQKNFVSLQKFHNIQLRCEQWVDDVIKGIDSLSPCITVIDEAYVQQLLRKCGYEITCYDLNQFPKNSKTLANLLYSTD